MTIYICAAAAVVLLMLEAAVLLGTRRRSATITSFVTVVPVFPGDDLLPERLSALSDCTVRSRVPTGRIILLDFGADDRQKRICVAFCESEPAAEIIPSAGLEKNLAKMFAIRVEM
jgi:hypothetical protein